MHAEVRKWGNSLALRIPRAFAEDAHLAMGSEVDISLQDGKVIIDPNPRPVYSLKTLLKGVTSSNRHSEIDTGQAAGREAW